MFESDKITPDIKCLVDPVRGPDGLVLDDASAIQLLRNSGFDGEQLWLGKIPLKEFKPLDPYQVVSVNYFHKGINWDDHSIDYVFEADHDTFIAEFEFFLKMAWISHEYIRDKGLTFPIGVHWNPRIEQLVVHPGVVRFAVAQLFKDKVPCYYFATRGHSPWFAAEEWMESLDYEWLRGKDFFITPDHGTFIPHVTFNTESIYPKIKEYHGYARHLLIEKQLKISSNKPDYLRAFMPPRFRAGETETGGIHIEFLGDTDPDHRTITLALLMMVWPVKKIKTNLFTIVKDAFEGVVGCTLKE